MSKLYVFTMIGTQFGDVHILVTLTSSHHPNKLSKSALSPLYLLIAQWILTKPAQKLQWHMEKE